MRADMLSGLGDAGLALLGVTRGHIHGGALACEVDGGLETDTGRSTDFTHTHIHTVSETPRDREEEAKSSPCHNCHLARQVLERIQELGFGHVEEGAVYIFAPDDGIGHRRYTNNRGALSLEDGGQTA